VEGVGLSTIAKYIADLSTATSYTVLPEKDDKIDIEKGVISVNSVRRLYDETKTKLNMERIIIIDYAERMTVQAQNAFLKLLEEPGEGVHFILVSHSLSKLLPTVISRVVNLEIKPISSEQSNKLLDSLGVSNDKKRLQLLFMAEGLPAELTRLVSNKDYFDKRSQMICDARELLRSSLYQQLLIAQKYKDDRAGALTLLLDASNILKKTIVINPTNEIISRVDLLLKTYQRVGANGNIRLCLAKLVI
jgi:DNA polymerase-3 subunit delta'